MLIQENFLLEFDDTILVTGLLAQNNVKEKTVLKTKLICSDSQYDIW